MSRPWFRSMLMALVLALSFRTAVAATIVIVNSDSPNEGFNDQTFAAPVGGNAGTTLGAQRLNVFRAAASVWEALLQSNVTIRVDASFDPLTCNTQGAVLGRAGPRTVVADFPGARFSGTWYHVALANRLAGSDLTASNDDISAFFNSSIDQGCFGNARWYYGLDHAHGANGIDLLAVVIHELGHGLGFSTLTDLPSGAFFNGAPDAFSRFILDTSLGRHWHEMTNSERQASAVRTGQVVWDGPTVTAEAPQVLQNAPRVTVNSPPSLAGDLVFGLADFGPPPSSQQVTQDVVLAIPNDACTAITNTPEMNGKIALIDRGGCPFASKALAAQAAGAVGVVIANNVAGAPPGMTGSAPGLTIPVVSVSQNDGNNIKAQLGGGVNLTIGFDASRLAGANASGKMFLYSPNPLELGSSISHWDPTATPNLLMEPIITSDLTSNVDLTLPALQDVGWSGSGGSGGGGSALPPLIQMLDGYPNPFGKKGVPQVSLSFVLDRAADVELIIADIKGRLVKRVFRGTRPAGLHTFTWDGTDEDGRIVDSGLFFARTHAGKDGASRRVALVR